MLIESAVFILRAIFVYLMLSIVGLDADPDRIIPDAPVSDFKLPMFGPDGYKTWELLGKQGKALAANEIEVQGMVLKVYSGDAAMSLEATLESPLAYVFPREHRATGPGYLHIVGPGFTVLGRNWSWKSLPSEAEKGGGLGHSAWIELHEEVRVTFKERLPEVL
ncbi:MAG: hypothetical protein B7X06_00415 [Verrucomicrobia bacterium 21-51-4]|nr:MAG: hypothetical protein B7X06_00415 [Verrucomicrobia bacterium 21-51-4]HQU08530.1 hypothetical protein [Opitutales bacterium]